MSEQLASYKHHILSAKEIGKSLLLGCPETSPFHQSIQAAQDTLYYINYVARSIHPSNGHAFLVQRASFFTVFQSMKLLVKSEESLVIVVLLLLQQGRKLKLNNNTVKKKFSSTALSLKAPELQSLPQVLEVPVIHMPQ